MAIAEIPLKLDKERQIRIPAVIINPKNNKSITLNLLPDTGASQTSIDDKFGRILGIDADSGTKVAINQGATFWYEHRLLVKVGNLKPVAVWVNVATGQSKVGDVAIMGMTTFLAFARVTYTGTGRIRFEENTPTTTTTAIPVSKPKPTVQKKAAYAHAYLTQQSWKKRI